MKWALACIAFAGCAAAAVSRVLRILKHVRKGGFMMRRRIFGSAGVGLASLGWAAAVASIFLRRTATLDWTLLVVADIVSVFMAWTLFRADLADKSGGNVAARQADALAELERIRREVSGVPTKQDERARE